jgi:hypothetical protein
MKISRVDDTIMIQLGLGEAETVRKAFEEHATARHNLLIEEIVQQLKLSLNFPKQE